MDTQIYRVQSVEPLHPSDPLNVQRFYPHTERHHRRTMQDRQDMILYLAGIHARAVTSNTPLGLCRIPMRLTSLREWVYDYRVVFDHFFTVYSTGYHLTDKHEVSIVIPRDIEPMTATPTHTPRNKRNLVYVVPDLPNDGQVSKVFIQLHNRQKIIDLLVARNRLDLYAPVEWLLNRECPEVNFYFRPAGKLQLRDTSVWPVRCVENWPSWLRELLFGPGIDIEAAYMQFLMEHIRSVYPTEEAVRLFFPDIQQAMENKAEWRAGICRDVLGLEVNEDNLNIVKTLSMSIANGSRVSGALLAGGSGYSVTRDIIIHDLPDISEENLMRIGEYLHGISRQFAKARRLVCLSVLNVSAGRANQKKVFSEYFDWERQARYKIWEAVDRHGIMVHDGIDGIPDEYRARIPQLISELGLLMSE